MKELIEPFKDQIIEALIEQLGGPLKEQVSALEEQAEELATQDEEARGEKCEELKEKMQARVDKAKEDVEKAKEEAKKKLEELKEEIKKQIEKTLEEAEAYFQELKQSAEAIPPGITGYTTAFASLATQSAGAISAAIMNPGSASFTAPAIMCSVAIVKKTKDDLKASILAFNTNLGQLDKCLGIIYSVPIVGSIVQGIISTALSPLKIAVDIANQTISILP